MNTLRDMAIVERRKAGEKLLVIATDLRMSVQRVCQIIKAHEKREELNRERAFK